MDSRANFEPLTLVLNRSPDHVVMSQRLNVRFPGGASRARQALEILTEHLVAELVVAKNPGCQVLMFEFRASRLSRG